MSVNDDFERGRREGLVQAELEDHAAHLTKINGSIDRFATVVERLTEKIASGLTELASQIRTLAEDARLAEERVKVAASTLAKETERRRAELADTVTASDRAGVARDRKFSKRERLVALAITVILGLAGLYIATH